MKLAVVVIARNEGERFKACVESLRASSEACVTVYVDSGSTDGSVAWARQAGLEVLELDMSVPFTAARARNAGFRRAQELCPELEYVQFIDGDCQIRPEWFPVALDFMATHPEVAVCCGRRRELYPERSVFNRLCDIEWDTPVGEAKACGGDALMRVQAFLKVGGYRPDLIAGEEPELCVRLRAQNWKIWRLDCEMTLHDAAIYRFSQWWRRTLRAGYAFANGAYLHGAAPEKHWVIETRRALVWGGVLPMLGLISWPYFGGSWAVILFVYALQYARLFKSLPGSIGERRDRSFYLVIGKFPEVIGCVRFYMDLWRGRAGRIVEYK